MNMLDNHVHTTFSRDGKDSMEKVIKKAMDKGIVHLTFTDHMEYNTDKFSIDFGKYCKTIEEFQWKYKNYINLYKGIEVGYQNHLKDEINNIINKYAFDFVLCSTHTVDKINVPDPKFFEGYSKEEAYRKYFTSILETVSEFKNFDTYGHLDYIVRYGNYENNKVIYNDYKDVLDALLKTIIASGKGIEINTSGIRYNLEAMHPNQNILRRYKELGGEIITVGSDSHQGKDLCKDFYRAYDMLEFLDYRYVCMFKKRTPVYISIEKTREGTVA